RFGAQDLGQRRSAAQERLAVPLPASVDRPIGEVEDRAAGAVDQRDPDLLEELAGGRDVDREARARRPRTAPCGSAEPSVRLRRSPAPGRAPGASGRGVTMAVPDSVERATELAQPLDSSRPPAGAGGGRGKVSLTPLGCRVNQAEMDELAARFHAVGYEIVPFE